MAINQLLASAVFFVVISGRNKSLTKVAMLDGNERLSNFRIELARSFVCLPRRALNL